MRKNPLVSALGALFPLATACLALLPAPSNAQNIGPGTITTTQTISSGSRTVVGGTTIQPASGAAITVNGTGSVLLDSSSGAIVLAGGTGSGLNISGTGSASSSGSNLTITEKATSVAALDVSGSGTAVLSNAVIHSTGLFSGSVGAYGVISQTGASVTLTGGSITTDNPGNVVAYAYGGRLSLTDVTVTSNALTSFSGGTSSYGAYGISAFNGGSATVSGGSVTTYGEIGVGLRSSASGSSFQATGTTVNTLGESGYGAMATGGAVMNLTNVSVTTLGEWGIGLYSRGSTLTSNGATVLTSGENGLGAYAAVGGTLNITGGSVTTNGDDGHGLSAEEAASTLIASNVTVATSGEGAIGAYASDGGNVSVSGGTIATTGASAHGATASEASSQVTLTNVPITVSGVGAHGLAVLDGGTIDGNGVTVNASGNGGSALFLSGVAGTTNTANIGSQSTLNSTGGPAIAVYNGVANVTLAQTSVSGNGEWLSVATRQIAPNAVPLRATQPSVSTDGVSETLQTGAVTNPAPSATLSPAVLTLTATGATLDGAAVTDSASTSNVSLEDGTVWNLTGNSNLTNLVNDPSSIVFSAPTGDPTLLSSYKTLTVSNYTGVAGSSITLNTYLGSDGSPSDRLVIDEGAATGSTQLLIRNTGGPGAVTETNGILVVDAVDNATTTTNAFSLGNELRAGAYSYALFRGAVDGSSTDSWYLRSDFVVPPEPPAPPEPPPPEPPAPPAPLPPDPPPDPLPPGTYPIIGPELATYGVVQPTAREMGLTTLGTMHERIGDTLTSANAQADPDGWASSAWARVFGQEVDNRYRAYADPRTDGRILGAQAGVDLWQGSLADGHRDAAGVYLAYANTQVDVNGLVTNPEATAYELVRTGRVNLDAVSGGGYWTHYGPSGWYLDGVVQGTRYNGTARTEYASLTTRGDGLITSLEGGYPFALSWGPNFILEPQAQVIWQHVWFRPTEDAYSTVSLGSSSGTTARLGVRGQWTIVSENGHVWQPYARVNVWRDMGGGSTATYAGVDQVPLIMQTTRADAAIGVTAKLLAGLSFYAQLGYQFGVSSDNERRDGVAGDAGVRYRW